jgi:hypothetical protein
MRYDADGCGFSSYAETNDARLVCRGCGISRPTLRLWWDLITLNRRPPAPRWLLPNLFHHRSLASPRRQFHRFLSMRPRCGGRDFLTDSRSLEWPCASCSTAGTRSGLCPSLSHRLRVLLCQVPCPLAAPDLLRGFGVCHKEHARPGQLHIYLGVDWPSLIKASRGHRAHEDSRRGQKWQRDYDPFLRSV